MNEDRIEMSQRERDRLKVMAPVMSGERTQREAARLLKLCVRQVRRLQRRLAPGFSGMAPPFMRIMYRPSPPETSTKSAFWSFSIKSVNELAP